MGDLGDHRSECDHEFHVESLDHLQNCVDEGSPTQVGFDALDEHEVSLSVVERQAMNVVGGPLDDSPTFGSDPQVGSVFVEVEELVSVDTGQMGGLWASHRFDSSSRCTADIEPAVPSCDQNG